MTLYYQQRIQNTPVRRRPPRQAMALILLVVLIGGLVAAGFIYAISLRGQAVEYGYRTQELLRLRKQLEREKQQLELERAYYRSPEVIERAAKELGLVRPDASRVILTGSNGEFRKRTQAPHGGLRDPSAEQAERGSEAERQAGRRQ